MQGMRLSLTIPQDDYARLARDAKDENRSLSGQVLYLMRLAWRQIDQQAQEKR
jgi:hypothetical protein